MFKKKLFGNNIPPSCEYCRFAVKKSSGNSVCRYGSALPDEPCGKYVYDPLKREPKALPAIPKYTADDFKL
ncbi:MAG: hypothetical protein IJ192_03830 [Clostridia bacterium]|nr:hypothetical protein [Clostridia bacterium]